MSLSDNIAYSELFFLNRSISFRVYSLHTKIQYCSPYIRSTIKVYLHISWVYAAKINVQKHFVSNKFVKININMLHKTVSAIKTQLITKTAIVYTIFQHTIVKYTSIT